MPTYQTSHKMTSIAGIQEISLGGRTGVVQCFNDKVNIQKGLLNGQQDTGQNQKTVQTNNKLTGSWQNPKSMKQSSSFFLSQKAFPKGSFISNDYEILLRPHQGISIKLGLL